MEWLKTEVSRTTLSLLMSKKTEKVFLWVFGKSSQSRRTLSGKRGPCSSRVYSVSMEVESWFDLVSCSGMTLSRLTAAFRKETCE